MGIRFRRRIKLIPGIHLNLSGSGGSFSLGPRGASVSVGRRGTYLNTGLPGTGIYSRERIGASAQSGARRATAAPTTSVSVTCTVESDGTISFLDADGKPASQKIVAAVKKQNRDSILNLIQEQCDQINEAVEALGRLHHDTPDCRKPPTYTPAPFDAPAPKAPIDAKPTFFRGLFKSQRDRIERSNQAARAAHVDARRAWEARRAEHEDREQRRQRLIENDIKTDVEAMGAFLEVRLQEIVWPRETSVDFDIVDGGSKVLFDVDLPELEDMPSKIASVPARGLKLTVKEMPATRVRKLYAEHVHGILFRLIGETFAALPTTKTVVASGYSQRPDPATGHVRDDYVISVRATRERWEEIDIANLRHIDVTEALGRFQVARNLQRSGKLLTIEPFAA